jgi:cytochrome c5
MAFAALSLALAGVILHGSAQTDGPSKSNDMLQSTMTGVYSAPQASRGEETYMNICVACHPAGTYTTPAFKTTWSGRPLADLYDQVKQKMPKNDPASLTAEEYAQVVAYLLKINGVPAGKSDLPADSDALKKIKIEMPLQERLRP